MAKIGFLSWFSPSEMNPPSPPSPGTAKCRVKCKGKCENIFISGAVLHLGCGKPFCKESDDNFKYWKYFLCYLYECIPNTLAQLPMHVLWGAIFAQYASKIALHIFI